MSEDNDVVVKALEAVNPTPGSYTAALVKRALPIARQRAKDTEELKRASGMLCQTLEEIFSGTSFLNQRALLQELTVQVRSACEAIDEAKRHD